MDCGSIERTVRAIFRPCVTSSGRTRRKSRTQGSVAGSDPRAVTTSASTSFHSVICIARFAKHTHSCNLMGLGPAWNVARFRIIDARSSGSCGRGTWWRSYTIWRSQRGGTTAEQQPYLALQGGGSEQLGRCICWRRLEDRQCRRPCLLLWCPVSPVDVASANSTYRLLELLQELMCLLFLGPVPCRLHHVVRRQHRLEALLRSVRSHVWSRLARWWGRGSGGRPETTCGGVLLIRRACTENAFPG
jgi:hypothetical protein